MGTWVGEGRKKPSPCSDPLQLLLLLSSFCVGLIGLFHLNLMEVVEQTCMYISSHKFGSILKG